MEQAKIKELKQIAAEIRLGALKAVYSASSGHPGGSLSIADVLAYLYFVEMNVDPKNPKWEDRDRLIVSKGHAGPVIYATLALMGFFPKEVLLTLNQGGTILPSHCDGTKTPGVDMTTGSLGQGISTACGVALGNKTQKKDAYTYLILGDGECNEGQVWEGAAFAPHFKLNKLIAFVDLNKQQLDGACDDVLYMGDMVDKWTSFGWNTIKVNGHDIDAIVEAIENGKAQTEKPTMIILDTVKGHGCELAEKTFPCHHIAFKPEDIAPSIAKAEAALEAARKA